MCQHDSGSSPQRPPDAIARRSVLAGAAVLAGVGAAGLAVPRAAQAAPDRRGSAAPRPMVVSGGSLVDPLTGHVTEDAVVVLAEGRVLQSGTRDQTRAAVGQVAGRAEQVDAHGLWIVPGLVDAHVHLNGLADAAGVLRAGATTARSASSTFFQDVALRALPDWVPGRVPRMLAAGVFVTPELGDTVLADPALAPLAALSGGVREPADLRYVTKVNLSRGVDVVKTRVNPRALPQFDYNEMVYDEEQLRSIVTAARSGGAGVMCHAYSAEGCHAAVSAGIRSLEHGVYVSEQTLALMRRRGTYFSPTLSSMISITESSDPVYAERGRRFVPVLQEAVRAAHALGVPIVAGTDSFGTATDPIGGEVRFLVEAGVPTLDALRAATTVPARMIGWSDRVGQLARGFHADLLAVDGNPLEDVSALERIRLVVAQGAVARNELAA